MPHHRAYLDWNATAPLHPVVRGAVLRALDITGNPSSIHYEGRRARAAVEEARQAVARLVGGDAENVVFTSGATEAASALLRQGLLGCCGNDLPIGMTVLAGATEHVAVLTAAGFGARLPVDPNGVIVIETVQERLDEVGPALVAVQLANNETGVIQPIREIADVVHQSGGALVVDAVQGPGRIPLDMTELAADALFLSAHKFGGPKGVGAIVFRDARTRLASAAIAGGGQERGQRGGTENLIGIIGMGAAAREVRAGGEVARDLSHLRDEFESRLNHIAPDVQIVGQGAQRLANTSLFALPGIRAESALVAFDLAGVAVSSGSACSSGKVTASHVLTAMGAPEWIGAGAIRISIGQTTTLEEIEKALVVIARLVAKRPQIPNLMPGMARNSSAA
ncbi:NifS Cysteine sulfinate desulfinase/cysteine desulfurase and related enzymes [Rhabdaerophilaceae bacterium]